MSGDVRPWRGSADSNRAQRTFSAPSQPPVGEGDVYGTFTFTGRHSDLAHSVTISALLNAVPSGTVSSRPWSRIGSSVDPETPRAGFQVASREPYAPPNRDAQHLVRNAQNVDTHIRVEALNRWQLVTIDQVSDQSQAV